MRGVRSRYVVAVVGDALNADVTVTEQFVPVVEFVSMVRTSPAAGPPVMWILYPLRDRRSELAVTMVVLVPFDGQVPEGPTI